MYTKILRSFCLLALSFKLSGITFPTCDELKKDYEIKAPQSKILVFTTPQGKKYILKQRNSSSARGQLMTVIEALGSHIAELAHIQTNMIKIIPAHSDCKNLFFPELPATLHTFMPGKTLHDAPAPYKKMALNQRCKAGKGCGLTLNLIKNMAQHRDLPKIMALDTFIGNNNRHYGNLLYDDEKNQFYSIDYGSAFRENMASPSIQNIKKLLKDKAKLNSSEKRALTIYVKTLDHLIKHFKPQRIIKKLQELIKTAGLKTTIKKDARFKHDAKKMINDWKHLIKISYQDSQTLSTMLYKLLNSTKK
jgi:hypothetical protein